MQENTFETTTNLYTRAGSLGNGGAGDVYSVRDADGKEFALKVLRDGDSTKRKRFQNELAFCQQKQHANIVRILDSGVTAKHLPFYVMKRYPNTLRGLIARGITRADALHLFAQMLDGVEAAHFKNVYHRDLKPENILWAPSGLVVADFGIAHFSEEELLTAIETQNDERLANFMYAAPEQKARASSVDHRADIFALGLILNEMFTSHVPSGVDYPLIVSVSSEYGYLDDIVKEMTRYSTSDRASSIAKVKEALIVRGNESVDMQRLNSLRNQVVPASEPDDPLQGRDVTLTGEIDYQVGAQQLLVGLHPEPPTSWWQALRNLPVASYIGSAPPQSVGWSNGKALLLVPPQQAEQVLIMFREWVSRTNESYRARLAQTARQEEAAKRMALARSQREEEERIKILTRLRTVSLR